MRRLVEHQRVGQVAQRARVPHAARRSRAGRNPRNSHCGAAMPAAESAAVTADGPGIGTIANPACRDGAHQRGSRIADRRRAGIGDQRDALAGRKRVDDGGGALLLVVLVQRNQACAEAVVREQAGRSRACPRPRSRRPVPARRARAGSGRAGYRSVSPPHIMFAPAPATAPLCSWSTISFRWPDCRHGCAPRRMSPLLLGVGACAVTPPLSGRRLRRQARDPRCSVGAACRRPLRCRWCRRRPRQRPRPALRRSPPVRRSRAIAPAAGTTIALILPLESPTYGRAAERGQVGLSSPRPARAGASARVRVIAHGDDGVLPAFAAAAQSGVALAVGPADARRSEDRARRCRRCGRGCWR